MDRTIFISYRREDARADAGRLYDRLDARYPGRVFRDVGSIEPGADWRKTINEVLRSAVACVVVIGPQWLTIADANGRRRLDDPDDMLRAEVASALASRARVFPVLVGEANTPRRSQLPNDLQRLASCNAIELSEQDFDAGFDRLVRALDRVVERPTWRTLPLRSWLAAAAVIVAVVSLAITYAVKRDASPPRAASSQQPEAPSRSDTDAEPASSGAVDATSVGQLTLRWTGANSTSWQVRDPKTEAVVKDLTVGAASSETAEFGAGRYVITIPDKPEIGPLPVTVTAGKVAVVAPAIGQITFHWAGANAVIWQLLDEKNRATVRQLVNGAGGSQTVDAGTGRYLLSITGMPELAPIAVTVSAGRMFTVAPHLGRVMVEWRGAKAIALQVLDAERRNAVRQLYLIPSSSQTLDMAPGRYLISPQSVPDMEPLEVTVTAGHEVRAVFG
jgi:hypothetical protein